MKQINLNDLQVHQRSVFLKPSMAMLLENGFKIIAVDNETVSDTTYFFFSLDGIHYGYIQQSSTDFWAVKMATVHEGSKSHGTGTRTTDTYEMPTLNDFLETLKATEKECRKYGLKPIGNLTFKILDYVEITK